MTDPSLSRVVMKLEDHGTAPIDGQVDFEKIQEAHDELGEWIKAHGGDA